MMKKLSAFSCMLALWTSALANAHGYVEPVDTSAAAYGGWDSATSQPVVSWAPGDAHYRQFAFPRIAHRSDTIVNAWRGEHLGLEALIISPVKLDNVTYGCTADGLNVEVAPMRYVITTDWRACGYPADTLPTYTVPDMIDHPGARVDMVAQSVRPLWCSIDVPSTLAPGDYNVLLTIKASGHKKPLGTLRATVRVSTRSLPAPTDYAFFLDLWQQPYSVSRYYDVTPWSQEHIDLLRPYVQRLARAGQKAISAILFYEPWGEQSRDKFEPMVETTRTPDGQWHFTYDVLDRWVELFQTEGIDSVIECFTMVPWQPQFRYINAATGQYEFLEAPPSSEAYRELWTAFLTDFAAHMRSRGWWDRTMIVMDERGLPDMLRAREVATAAVPDIKMSLAGSYHPELIDSLDCYTLIKGDFFPADVLKRRHDRGQTSLMYTCCATPFPSQFSNNDPFDGTYIPLYATATGHDGYLHWSFMNWTTNPLTDTRFHMFAPGDTYFIYPDNRSSIRYERMLQGIQLSEKLRLLRADLIAAGDIQGLQRLEAALTPIRSGALNPWYTTATVVRDLITDIDSLSN